LVAIIAVAAVFACGPGPGSATGPAQQTVQLVETRPHDVTAYTEGLVLGDDRLYESTGLYGQSTLREVDPVTGEVLRSLPLDDRYFGEGLAIVGEQLVQLTWHEAAALVYQASDFSHVQTFGYQDEGWGLCYDGSRLVMSNGTSALTFRDRSTFEVIGTVPVTANGEPVENLNELECVAGQVYANVLSSDSIIRIDPSNGVVTASIDASSLRSPEIGDGVLNGIAYDSASDTFLLTGKNWPSMFQVRFVAR